MDTTYEEYKNWLKDAPIDPNVERKYKAAVELLGPRKILEDRLSANEKKESKNVTAHLATYKEYIDLELKEGNPVRIRSIYERRITDHCLIPLVWREYSQYLEEKLKDFESSLELLIRAVRNCNWSGALWVRILKCCERLGQSKSEVCKHLEAGLVAGLVGATDFLDLWLAYLDYRRRQLAYDDDDECLDKGSDFVLSIFSQSS